ncbi:hypothetical protein SCHPADRAFT_894095 [Schizopora paradoxa]|uniref:Uncharacterized protein n=1 Tax=Schizopora paradoxa TaxID=27342 RepID=A0A0H2RF18_9AGAM|nr:hypothetical protein SCHPADRAFT_894095 [Schizopora paradoxa]
MLYLLYLTQTNAYMLNVTGFGAFPSILSIEFAAIHLELKVHTEISFSNDWIAQLVKVSGICLKSQVQILYIQNSKIDYCFRIRKLWLCYDVEELGSTRRSTS